MNQSILAVARDRKLWMFGAWYGLAMLVFASVLASLNRQILVLVTESLKRDLHITDTQVGALNGIALSLIGAVATVPLGWLADRVNRLRLLSACVLIWSASTFAFALSQSYAMLFACGMGIALGEAVLGPITYSIIPDLFPPERRIVANYVFFVCGILGGAAGLVLSGGIVGFVESARAALPTIVADLEPWRVALIASTLPGPLLALLIMFIPLRRQVLARTAAAADGLLAYFREHARTLFGVFVGFGFAATGYGTVAMWMAVALMRVFHESPADVGVRLGAISGIASVVGVILSGTLVRTLRARHAAQAPMRVAQLGIWAAFAATPFYLVATSATQMYVIVAVQIAAIMSSLSLSPTLLQSIAPPLMRGRVIALGGTIYVVFASLSPLAVGIVSDRIFNQPGQLLWSMAAISLPCFAAGALALRFAEKTLQQTMDAAAE